METQIKKLDYERPDEKVIAEAGRIILAGGLVAFPTETVYGLGGDALNPESSKKIYAAKGRPSDNPLIVHIADKEDLYRIARTVPEKAEKLMEAFWPGPLTMIFDKNELVPGETTGGLDTVAVRMPSDRIAAAFIKAAGGFVAAPSANVSGRPSTTTAAHVAEDLSGRIEMILDGGQAVIGLESTIVDMTVDPPVILRPGAVTKEMMEEQIGAVEVDKAMIAPDSGIRPKAPGMKIPSLCAESGSDHRGGTHRGCNGGDKTHGRGNHEPGEKGRDHCDRRDCLLLSRRTRHEPGRQKA